nr:uncharacterized protein LOC122273596 [Parasteatoda tepidariorum]
MDIPELLLKLLSDNSIEARNYRNHIREYNSALAFASFGARIKPPPGNGPYFFRIHGQIYHMVSPLYSNDQNNAGYGQLYIFDSTEATNRRIENNTGYLRSVMEQLDSLLRQINPFAASYLQMHQFIQLNPAADVNLVFMEDPPSDLRRYNAPTSKTEVAAIFVGDNGEPPSNRDLCIYPVADSCKTISPMNPCIDPMVYPLLFPQGDCGWHAEMESGCTRAALAIRSEFSLLHSSGKLFQQFIVDVYVRTEGSRLNYLRLNQKDLRVELYQGLLDALQSEAHSNNVKLGKLISLQSTFRGFPRSMQQNYQDAMAIVRKFGRPDIFLTFTCNPAWPEIASALQRHQRPENRPDIIVRVFKLKLTELLDDILKRHVFGKVISFIFVIEFQKRWVTTCPYAVDIGFCC